MFRKRSSRLSPRVLRQLGALFGLVGLVGRHPVEAGEEYRIDVTRSEFVVQLFKAGVGAALAHDHVIRATKYTGRIQGDIRHPAAARIVVEVQAAALEPDEPDVRQKYNLPTLLSDQEREEIKATMTSPQQLAIAQYPTLTFTSTHIERQGDGEFSVGGDLTIRGVARSLVFPVRVEERAGVIHAQGSVRFKQSSFGYEPYSALFGAIRNQDEALLHFDVIATPPVNRPADQAAPSESAEQ